MRLHPPRFPAGARTALVLLAFAFAAPSGAVDLPAAAPVPEAAAAGVHGPLAADATWSGRVLLAGPVEVPAGVTLTILPGAELRFAPGAALNVGGVLSAAGTAERPIVFGPAEPAHTGDWGGLSFSGLPGGSALRHCRVLRAAAITVNASRVTLEDCEIVGGRTGLSVSNQGAEVVARRSRFLDLREGGATFIVGASGQIVSCVFERCGPHGVSATTGSTCEIRESRVSACETGIEIVRSAPLIFGNTVRGCARGIALTYAGGGRPIQGNTLEDNATGIYCQQFSAPEIRGNTIAGGDDGIYCFQGASPLIVGNTIRTAKTGIYCTQLSNPAIEANLIEGNATGILLNLSSYAIIRGNSFLANATALELGNMSFDWERRVAAKPSRGRQQQRLGREARGKEAPGSATPDGFDTDTGLVDARENWWGEAATREMEEKGVDANITALVDGYDVPVRTYEGYEGEYLQDRIMYAPWLKQPAANAPPVDQGAGR